MRGSREFENNSRGSLVGLGERTVRASDRSRDLPPLDQRSHSCATVAFRLISGLSSNSLSHICNPPCLIVVPALAVSICISSFQGVLAVPMLTSLMSVG